MAVAQSIQKIFGVFNAQTGQLIGFTISGETPFQTALLGVQFVPNFAGIRLLSSAGNIAAVALGQNTLADGGGADFAVNPNDTFGATFTGAIAGTVLSVASVQTGNGNILPGLSVNRGDTGATVAIISSNGTGTGGVGTYNLNTAVSIPGPLAFSVDNNSTFLVGFDGGRWDNTQGAVQNTSLIPAITNTYFLGSTTAIWAALYANAVNANVVNVTPSAGTAVVINASVANAGINIKGASGDSARLVLTDGHVGSPQWGLYAGQTASGTFDLFNFLSASVAVSVNGAGTVTINQPSSAIGLVVNGSPGQQAMSLIAGSGLNLSKGMFIRAGTGGLSEFALLVNSQNNATSYFQVRGDGQITGGGPTAGALVDMTPDTGTFNATLNGLTTSPTVPCRWRRSGGQVTLVINTNASVTTGTSLSTGFNLSGIPPAIQTVTQVVNAKVAFMQDNGVNTDGGCQLGAASGTITLYKGTSGASSSWTATGTKGLTGGFSLNYTLD